MNTRHNAKHTDNVHLVTWLNKYIALYKDNTSIVSRRDTDARKRLLTGLSSTLSRHNGLTLDQWDALRKTHEDIERSDVNNLKTFTLTGERAEALKKIGLMMSLASTKLDNPTIRLYSSNHNMAIVLKWRNAKRSLFVHTLNSGAKLMDITPSIRQVVYYGCDREQCVKVLRILCAFAMHPKRMAQAYATKYERCGFCNRELADPRSVNVGYGPVCADNYGLPWGEAETLQ